MKTKIYILVLLFLAAMGFLNAQTTAGTSSCSKTAALLPEPLHPVSTLLPVH